MTRPFEKALNVAFFVGRFPVTSQPFIIEQVAGLLDHGVHVDVFALTRGTDVHISSLYETYRMYDRTRYVLAPHRNIRAALRAIMSGFRLMATPLAVRRVLKRCWTTRSFRPLFLVLPFVGKQFDVVHCHFGPEANDFLTIRDMLRLEGPFVTTFYGYDVSAVLKGSPPDIYARLMRECGFFFVMSDNMKRRVLAQGFDEQRVKVLPASIDVDSYPFLERSLAPDASVEIISIARFVEKKGLDDLLRALAIVRKRTSRSFRCSLVGGGQLEQELRNLRSLLHLDDVVEFKGYLKLDDVIQLLLSMHIMVAPSKTARDGDME